MLQIDGIEIVKPKAILKYISRRQGIEGETEQEVLKNDIVLEEIDDMLRYFFQYFKIKRKELLLCHNESLASLPESPDLAVVSPSVAQLLSHIGSIYSRSSHSNYLAYLSNYYSKMDTFFTRIEILLENKFKHLFAKAEQENDTDFAILDQKTIFKNINDNLNFFLLILSYKKQNEEIFFKISDIDIESQEGKERLKKFHFADYVASSTHKASSTQASSSSEKEQSEGQQEASESQGPGCEEDTKHYTFDFLNLINYNKNLVNYLKFNQFINIFDLLGKETEKSRDSYYYKDFFNTTIKYYSEKISSGSTEEDSLDNYREFLRNLYQTSTTVSSSIQTPKSSRFNSFFNFSASKENGSKPSSFSSPEVKLINDFKICLFSVYFEKFFLFHGSSSCEDLQNKYNHYSFEDDKEIVNLKQLTTVFEELLEKNEEGQPILNDDIKKILKHLFNLLVFTKQNFFFYNFTSPDLFPILRNSSLVKSPLPSQLTSLFDYISSSYNKIIVHPKNDEKSDMISHTLKVREKIIKNIFLFSNLPSVSDILLTHYLVLLLSENFNHVFILSKKKLLFLLALKILTLNNLTAFFNSIHYFDKNDHVNTFFEVIF